MKKAELIADKIFLLPELLQRIAQWRIHNTTIVFTNGVFDLLHKGHIQSLTDAAKEGDYLIVALNTDDSVKRLKGNDRPLTNQDARALLVASLLMVDAVVLFAEDTPLELIKAVRPDVLVKGGDYTIDQIAGAKEVIAYNGRVVIHPILPGYSTTSLIKQVKRPG